MATIGGWPIPCCAGSSSFTSCVISNDLHSRLRKCQTFLLFFFSWGSMLNSSWVWQRTERWVSTGRRADLNHCRTGGSTFIRCCHYSLPAIWQMALWDIGFYGRSSFISNFFSHLMRSSRSSQIHFAVWILIEHCSLSSAHPSLPLVFSVSLLCSLPPALSFFFFSLPTSTASLLTLNGFLLSAHVL